MAEKKTIIVIKKITISGGGHHGGSWKVALADFMTAMMAFFLVMWLLGQSDETKKAVSDYFSTPSVLEYNFQNFGVEITLEKLFLDLVNEPLKAFQQFMEPADKTPNILDSGSQKVVTAYVADQLKELAKNFNVSQNAFEFDIPDYELFVPGSSRPVPQFLEVLEKIKAVTNGLDDADVSVTSMMFIQTMQDQKKSSAYKTSDERADLIAQKLKSGFEHPGVGITSSSIVKDKKGEGDAAKLVGLVRFRIQQRDLKTDGKKTRSLERFGKSNQSANIYDDFVQKAVQRKTIKK